MRWEFRERCFEWTDAPVRHASASTHTRLMGILNVTPDSFSDGGMHASLDAAVSAALAMVDNGAEIIDVGGESTRPGSDPVSAEVELERVVPVIAAVRARTDAVLSVDTTKASVAYAALDAGADIINDVSGLTLDPEMVSVAAETGAGVVVMHMRGLPKTMQTGDLRSTDIVGEVCAYLHGRIERLVAAGVARSAICVDPGIGFGKTLEQNLALSAAFSRYAALERPVLLGPSRKSFIGALTDQPVDRRLPGTAAACALAAADGVHWLRVHDVREMMDVVRVAEAIKRARGEV